MPVISHSFAYSSVMASKTVTKSFEYFNYFWCDYILALRFYIDATDFISRFYHIHMTFTRQLYSAIQYVNYIIMGQANKKNEINLFTWDHISRHFHRALFNFPVRNS